ncbi:hypothetical protein V6N13_018270 [Hibiscus sabdariffa]
MIGRGGAGIVYHGKMANGMEIAVKKLVGFGTSNHDHGFRAEIQTLGNIRHRNIVRLLAFCSNKETNLLVYEYMRNGSLGEALHGKKGGFIGWNLRYKIALEAATVPTQNLAFVRHGKLTSFFVLVAEPVGEFGEGMDMVQWAKLKRKGGREGMVDPRLTSAPKDETMHLLFIAMLCVQENSVERPTMREVVQMLSDFPPQTSSSSLIHAPPRNA